MYLFSDPDLNNDKTAGFDAIGKIEWEGLRIEVRRHLVGAAPGYIKAGD